MPSLALRISRSALVLQAFSGIDTAGWTGLVSHPNVSLEMAYLIYREHTIVSSASQDETTPQWLPLISISWVEENGRRDVHFLTNSRARCLNFREAENLGLERAKDWIVGKVLGLE